jgi:CDP-6-deoxy-D-xylo-4-hexulose-3-dehydrase
MSPNRHRKSNFSRNHYHYDGVEHRVVGSLENTDPIMNHTFFIGVYPGLTDPMIDHMISVLDRTLA